MPNLPGNRMLSTLAVAALLVALGACKKDKPEPQVAPAAPDQAAAAAKTGALEEKAPGDKGKASAKVKPKKAKKARKPKEAGEAGARKATEAKGGRAEAKKGAAPAGAAPKPAQAPGRPAAAPQTPPPAAKAPPSGTPTPPKGGGIVREPGTGVVKPPKAPPAAAAPTGGPLPPPRKPQTPAQAVAAGVAAASDPAMQPTAPVRQAGSAAAGHESVRLGPVRSAAPTPAKPVSLDIDMLLDRAQLAVVLGVKNGFVDFPLQGQTPVERYNHVRLVPRGEGNVLGLVIQVWRDRTIADARGRYEGFTKSYPGAQTNRAVTSRTFTASYADTHYLGFFALGERTNIVLTCSAPSCSPDKLHKVALALKRNLPRWSRSVQ